MSGTHQEDAPILRNYRLQGEYCQADLACPGIAPMVEPGQFVHVRMPGLAHRVLRRPFSVFDVDPKAGRLSIIYKVVGEGTAHLASLNAGTSLDLIGPLGSGYTLPDSDDEPIIVAGGYGCAATWLLAKCSPAAPFCLLGGRTDQDLLLVEEFQTLGGEVRLATEDGSKGHRGLVTDLLEQALAVPSTGYRKIYACGPAGMLRKLSEIAEHHCLPAEISLDHVMCCGVGACFACVLKRKTDSHRGWEYVRTCREGPVFDAKDVVWQ